VQEAADALVGRWRAQLLLHVRTADLNGRLGHYVGRAAANDATPVAIAA
jgi:hypothetical protein